jgi:methylmalonyl-CoA/ethylmalonyl-CoA epimerase
MKGASDMKVERIDHIHIAVKDLKKAVQLFSSIMETKWTGPIEPGPDIITAFDSLGLELLQQTTSKGFVANFIERRGEGLFSIGLKVSNLDEAVADLEEKGVRVPWKGVVNESLKVAMTHPKDTYGVQFELLEYEERTPITLANLNIDKVMDIPSLT